MVFAVSMKGTEDEIEHYAERVAGGYRWVGDSTRKGQSSVLPAYHHDSNK